MSTHHRFLGETHHAIQSYLTNKRITLRRIWGWTRLSMESRLWFRKIIKFAVWDLTVSNYITFHYKPF